MYDGNGYGIASGIENGSDNDSAIDNYMTTKPEQQVALKPVKVYKVNPRSLVGRGSNWPSRFFRL